MYFDSTKSLGIREWTKHFGPYNMQYEFHHFDNKFPMLESKELNELLLDIEANGTAPSPRSSLPRRP